MRDGAFDGVKQGRIGDSVPVPQTVGHSSSKGRGRRQRCKAWRTRCTNNELYSTRLLLHAPVVSARMVSRSFF